MEKLNQKGFGIGAILVLVVIAGVIVAVGWHIHSSDSNKNKTQQAAVNQQNTSRVAKTETSSVASVAIISKMIAAAANGGATVTVSLKNNDSIARTANVKVTFKNVEGQIIEEATGTSDAIPPGVTKDLVINASNKIAGYSEYNVEVTKVE